MAVAFWFRCWYTNPGVPGSIPCSFDLSLETLNPGPACHSMTYVRVASVREKYLENDIFPGQGKVREFCVAGHGNLERTWKVREKSGNLKINGYGKQTPENLFVLFNRGKAVLVLSFEIV